MKFSIKAILAILTVFSMVLSGCTGASTDSVENENINDENNDIPLPDCELNDSCFEPEEQLVMIPHSEGCDNINPIHCMLPFPSDAFLVDDETKVTGKRINYLPASLPGSGSKSTIEVPLINQMDGFSTSTQIMTAFSSTPELFNISNQDNILPSINIGHQTLLVNLETGDLVEHWVELDARAEDGEAVIIHIRTVKHLNFNTEYGVLVHGLMDISGQLIQPSEALNAIIDEDTTDSIDIENRRNDINNLIDYFVLEKDVVKSEIQAIWSFTTNSADSALGPIIQMRDDALDRIGGGIGCTIDSVDDNYGEDNLTLRRITGTFTTPQYTLSEYTPTLINRDENRMPVFVENREVPFIMTIPNTKNETNDMPITIWGHGFLGLADGGPRGWAYTYQTAMLTTDITGFSNVDYDPISFALLDPNYFSHHSASLEQGMINHVVMARTFSDACSNLTEFYEDDLKIINTDEIHWGGYSLGGIVGIPVMSLSPDINRGALFAGGGPYTLIAERSGAVQGLYYAFSLDISYENQMDRAVIMSAVIQQLWDVADPDVYSAYLNGGYSGLYENQYVSLNSMGDQVVPILSADRMIRSSGAVIMESSVYHPLETSIWIEGDNSASVAVYFDGNFTAPEENIFGPGNDAHSYLWYPSEPAEIAFRFILDGEIYDACEGDCS
jgi:pimeloyl-ACP methyl ester carboxylesterase